MAEYRKKPETFHAITHGELVALGREQEHLALRFPSKIRWRLWFFKRTEDTTYQAEGYGYTIGPGQVAVEESNHRLAIYSKDQFDRLYESMPEEPKAPVEPEKPAAPPERKEETSPIAITVSHTRLLKSARSEQAATYFCGVKISELFDGQLRARSSGGAVTVNPGQILAIRQDGTLSVLEALEAIWKPDVPPAEKPPPVSISYTDLMKVPDWRTIGDWVSFNTWEDLYLRRDEKNKTVIVHLAPGMTATFHPGQILARNEDGQWSIRPEKGVVLANEKTDEPDEESIDYDSLLRLGIQQTQTPFPRWILWKGLKFGLLDMDKNSLSGCHEYEVYRGPGDSLRFYPGCVFVKRRSGYCFVKAEASSGRDSSRGHGSAILDDGRHDRGYATGSPR